jgi:hypothetical protein
MPRPWRRIALLVCFLPVASAAGQTSRIATSIDAVIASAVFFHGRTVVLQQKVLTEADVSRLGDAPKPVYVFWKDRPGRDDGEIRGEFWDIGRLDPRDGRFAGYDFARLIETVNRGQWPGRDQIFVLVGASMQPAAPPRAPTVRAIAMAPDDYVEREVKVIGRFKGHNLYGDVPFALGKGKWDFVLQSADGVLWVTGVRPRGKDFDLDPAKRVDTGRWVEVTGVVRRQGPTTYIDGSAIKLASAPEEAAVEVTVPVPRQPAPEVIFSAPVQDDRDVDRSAPVRVQFSRDMDPRTIRDRVVVKYVVAAGATSAAPPPFTATYNDAAHAIELKFAQPLEAFQQVRVELLEGIAALDGQSLPAWTLTFTTGR